MFQLVCQLPPCFWKGTSLVQKLSRKSHVFLPPGGQHTNHVHPMLPMLRFGEPSPFGGSDKDSLEDLDGQAATTGDLCLHRPLYTWLRCWPQTHYVERDLASINCRPIHWACQLELPVNCPVKARIKHTRHLGALPL